MTQVINNVFRANDPNHGYLGNRHVKRAGVSQTYTQAELDEYVKCRDDPVYFCMRWLKVIHPDHGLVPFTLYDFQKDMINHMLDNRFSIFKCPRQVGKTTTSAAALLHFALFNPDKKIAILANKGMIAKEILARITLMLENVPFFLQPGCKALNKGSIYLDNESSIKCFSTSSSSVRGDSYSWVFLDEYAFVQRAEEFYTSTYPTITAGKSTKVTIVSTPNGVGNSFHSLWEGAVQKVSDYQPFSIHWSDVPGRDQKWKEQTIANTSEEQFRQEFECDFRGGSNTLISSNSLLGLRSHKPVDVNSGVNIYKKPEKGHQYVITVDVSKGRGQDYHAFTIFDCSDSYFEQVALFRDNTMSPMILPNILEKFGKYYNDALIIVENNNNGEVVCNGLYYDIEYDNMFVESYTKSGGVGANMNKKTKRIGCSNLKDLIESGKLIVVDPVSIAELTTFTARGSSYEATLGCHDDTTMNLVMFGWFVSTDAFGDISQIDLKSLLHSDKIDEMNEEEFSGQVYYDNGMDSTEVMTGYNEMIEQQREWQL